MTKRFFEKILNLIFHENVIKFILIVVFFYCYFFTLTNNKFSMQVNEFLGAYFLCRFVFRIKLK